VMHQMPEDRLVSDRNHRLRNAFGHVPDTRAETAAEQYCFHLSGLMFLCVACRLAAVSTPYQGQEGTCRLLRRVDILRLAGASASLPAVVANGRPCFTITDQSRINHVSTRPITEACRWRRAESTNRRGYLLGSHNPPGATRDVRPLFRGSYFSRRTSPKALPAVCYNQILK